MTDIKIKKVNFLVPVYIELEINGNQHQIHGQLDYINKKFHHKYENLPALDKYVFHFINNATTLEENMFEATEEIYEEAGRAKDHFEAIHKENVGDNDA